MLSIKSATAVLGSLKKFFTEHWKCVIKGKTMAGQFMHICLRFFTANWELESECFTIFFNVLATDQLHLYLWKFSLGSFLCFHTLYKMMALFLHQGMQNGGQLAHNWFRCEEICPNRDLRDGDKKEGRRSWMSAGDGFLVYFGARGYGFFFFFFLSERIEDRKRKPSYWTGKETAVFTSFAYKSTTSHAFRESVSHRLLICQDQWERQMVGTKHLEAWESIASRAGSSQRKVNASHMWMRIPTPPWKTKSEMRWRISCLSPSC